MDNITITADQRDAYRLDAELKHHAGTVVSGIIEVGRCLKEINDRNLFEHLGYSNLADYAEAAIGIKERAAYNYITAFETYGAEGLEKYGKLGITKLVALTTLNDTDRKEMLESGTAAELSTRALNDKIKELKGENDQLRFQFDEITEGAKKQDEVIAEKDEEIRKLKLSLTQATRPIVADMSDEEKNEIRREAEKKVKAEKEDEIRRLKNKIETAEKNVKDSDRIQTEQANRIAELSDQLEAAVTANSELQANAKKAAPPAGNTELLKYHFEALQSAYSGVIEVLRRFAPDEREKFKTALVRIAADIEIAAESL